MASTRRLTAILAADVAGYSRLMGADEEGTHERLRAHLRDLVEPKIDEHHGRIVKNTGDGMLAEFASVVDAVRCAVEVQRGMIDREPDLPDERRIRFRIGVNLGDVIADRDDIFGDGVNVAARLEALAEPGGICISRMVRDNIRDKLPYPFDDTGEQSVKNIARPVRVYALRSETIADLPAVKVSSGTSVSQPVVAPRLSIVVLPFVNLSNDPDQQYFADGITEDLTTDLSRVANILVISRNTAFTYRNKPVDTKQIGRELGVRYVLEGSVRRSGNQVRVNAQLIDAERDAHLWADRFDGDTADLFALQDEITSRIAIALNLELIAAEAVRPTEHPDALDYILRGRAATWKPNSPEKWAETIGLFERALALDPRSIEAQCWLAVALASRVRSAMSHTAATDIARADALIGQALAASPRDPRVRLAKGEVLRAQGRLEEAIPEYEAAVASNRNWVGAIVLLGQCKLMTGSTDEAIPLMEKAIRLSPRDPAIAIFYTRIGVVHLLQSRIDQAIGWLEKARNANPVHSAPHAYLASVYAIKGYNERASSELAEARRLANDDRYSSLARLREVGYWGVPKIRALYEATYFVGLRKAGMPEG
jgi:TolB-like protein/class 3 adenylate cyclase/cytochrome c-type biogenesis protein CcmH/NrfG